MQDTLTVSVATTEVQHKKIGGRYASKADKFGLFEVIMRWLKRLLCLKKKQVRKFARVPSHKSNMLPTNYPPKYKK